MRAPLATLLVACPTALLAACAGDRLWLDRARASEVRAELLVAAMTLDEKIGQLHGQIGVNPEFPCGNSARHVPGVPRLGIPTMRITNGPAGVGPGDCVPQKPATALPSALALAASWDPQLARAFGEVAGTEALNLATHVFEAPGLNIARVPQNGRNFEYFGEDPYLAGRMAVEQIRAVQSKGIIAMPKHYAANNQETNRFEVNELIDERTLREIYLPAFEMAVKDGGAAAIMCAYPRVNGTYACENEFLLSTVLRKEWGFSGYVQSDFGAVHSTAPSILAGTDLEMNSGTWYNAARINAALAAGAIRVADIDVLLKRRFYAMFRLGQFDRPLVETPIDAARHGRIARSIAEQSAVLLKNENGQLPLAADALRSIALIGPQAHARDATTGGDGSSRVVPLYTVTPIAGLRNVLKELGSSATVSYNDGADPAAAAKLAASSDIAIVMVGDIHTEGADRPNLSLPGNQDALVSAVAMANPRTVVVLKNGGPLVMPWIDRVRAVLEAWYPGSEDGSAVARLLFGIVTPSGKLPVTFPRSAGDVPAHTPAQWPGVAVNGVPTATYSEGLQVGYRWYDAQGVKPLFPFGFGLSYTTFLLWGLETTPVVADGTTPIRVEFWVENTGKRRGAEVAQVYLGFPPATGSPPKRLVGFRKVWLEPGERAKVTLTIDPKATNRPLSYWDSNAREWAIANGSYRVYLGSSAADIAATGAFTLDR
jgi:beta-glucosidase